MSKENDFKPIIMVAPNGAYKQPNDDYDLPITANDVAKTALECYLSGATAIHAHTRNELGEHVLDVGLTRALLESIRAMVPNIRIQITTEAIGKFTTIEQMDFVKSLKHDYYSAALKELVPDDSDTTFETARIFYEECNSQGISFQHILYSADDLLRLIELIDLGIVPTNSIHGKNTIDVLFVLGRYSEGQQSRPVDISPFIEILQSHSKSYKIEAMVCAFGRHETDCLVHAASLGLNCRTGFENNTLNEDGAHARNNAERVKSLVSELKDIL